MVDSGTILGGMLSSDFGVGEAASGIGDSMSDLSSGISSFGDNMGDMFRGQAFGLAGNQTQLSDGVFSTPQPTSFEPQYSGKGPDMGYPQGFTGPADTDAAADPGLQGDVNSPYYNYSAGTDMDPNKLAQNNLNYSRDPFLRANIGTAAQMNQMGVGAMDKGGSAWQGIGTQLAGAQSGNDLQGIIQKNASPEKISALTQGLGLNKMMSPIDVQHPAGSMDAPALDLKLPTMNPGQRLDSSMGRLDQKFGRMDQGGGGLALKPSTSIPGLLQGAGNERMESNPLLDSNASMFNRGMSQTMGTDPTMPELGDQAQPQEMLVDKQSLPALDRIKTVNDNMMTMYPKQVETVGPALSKVAPDLVNNYGINTPKRVNAFMAQVAHESGGFGQFGRSQGSADLEEVGASAASKYENGKYKGRGLIQLTHKENYERYGKAIGEPDLVDHPERAANPETAWKIAGAYWKENGLNELADKGDMDGITRRIQGSKAPAESLKERRRLYTTMEGL